MSFFLTIFLELLMKSIFFCYFSRRQHRLEQEQADLEYEIRLLMAQPERNKTDSDKSREESMIARLVEVVQLRNEVIECLEMDRLREAEEDMVSGNIIVYGEIFSETYLYRA